MQGFLCFANYLMLERGFVTLRLCKRVAAVIVVLVVLLSLAAFSSNRAFLFSKDLQVQKLWSDTKYIDQYVSELYDSSGHIGEVAFTLNEVPGAFFTVCGLISHITTTPYLTRLSSSSQPLRCGKHRRLR